MLAACQSQLFMVSETNLDAPSVARERSWRSRNRGGAVFAHPGHRRVSQQGRNVSLSLAGLVAPKLPLVSISPDYPPGIASCGRLAAGVIRVAPHVTAFVQTVYGDPHSKEHTEQLLDAAFVAAETYGGPCVIAGDFNIEPADSFACSLAGLRGWVDAAAALAARAGTSPETTHVKGDSATRIDQLWANPVAARALSAARVLDWVGHKPLIISFDWARLRPHLPRWRLPIALPLPSPAEDLPCAPAEAPADFDEEVAAVAAVSVDSAFAAWNVAAESCLVEALGDDSLPRRHFGRGRARRVVKQRQCEQRARPGRDAFADDSPNTVQIRLVVKQLRRLASARDLRRRALNGTLRLADPARQETWP